MDTKATATLQGGSKVQGRLTTAHAASSYGQPVFVDDDGQVYDWFMIASIDTATEMRRKGGKSTSDAKRKASAENGKFGGRPKKTQE